eukprot:tig00000480_g1325.t1
MAHPSLNANVHPRCAEVIAAYHKCHQEHQVGRVFGACTDLFFQIEKCLTDEYLDLRAKNHAEAKRTRKLYEERVKADAELAAAAKAQEGSQSGNAAGS